MIAVCVDRAGMEKKAIDVLKAHGARDVRRAEGQWAFRNNYGACQVYNVFFNLETCSTTPPSCTPTGQTAARAVFIDDAPRNVQAAAATGMHALQFRDAAALREELVALDLLPPRAGAAAP